jgi:hypothetical protein
MSPVSGLSMAVRSETCRSLPLAAGAVLVVQIVKELRSMISPPYRQNSIIAGDSGNSRQKC